MALYNNYGGGLLKRAQETYQGAQRAMGQQTKEGATTTWEGGDPGALQYVQHGIGAIQLPGQISSAYNSIAKGVNNFMGKFGAPNATSGVAETGGAAVSEIGKSVQMNTGAEVADRFMQELYAKPEYLGGDPALARASAETAANVWTDDMLKAGGEKALQEFYQTAYETPPLLQEGLGEAGKGLGQGGLSGFGLASVGGGLGGGLLGGAIGKAVGGETGQKVGGIAGSVGGAYLGGLALEGLGGLMGGATGAAAAGAAAGSVAPGAGTLIGAGLGALGSLFL